LLIDALGVEVDAAVQKLDREFREALAVGRPLDFASHTCEEATDALHRSSRAPAGINRQLS